MYCSLVCPEYFIIQSSVIQHENKRVNGNILFKKNDQRSKIL